MFAKIVYPAKRYSIFIIVLVFNHLFSLSKNLKEFEFLYTQEGLTSLACLAELLVIIRLSTLLQNSKTFMGYQCKYLMIGYFKRWMLRAQGCREVPENSGIIL